jgi:WD40 repeat protein
MKSFSTSSCFKVCLCLVLCLSAASCTRGEENPTAARQASRDSAVNTTILATIANDDKPPQAVPGHAEAPGAQDQPASYQVVFSASGRGVAYLVEKGGKVSVVHNQSRGKAYAAVGTVVLSSDGRRLAYAALVDGKWRMVVDGREGRGFDTLLTPLFTSDGRHVAYQAKEGDKWYMVVDDTANAGTTASYTTPVFSSDSTLIAYIETADSNSNMRLIVSDLTFGRQIVKRSIGDLLFTTNVDRTRIAAEQVANGKHRIIDFSFAKPDTVHEGPLYEVIERLTVGDDGASVAYCALKDGKRLLVLNDREESLPKGLLPELPVIRPDKKGVGLLLGSEGKISLHQAFYNSTEKGKKYDEAAGLTYSKDGRFYAYAGRSGESWFVVANGKEGPAFDKVVTPLFSPDGRFLVYRARKDGKRFVVVADTNGTTIGQHPVYEQVFDVHFTADGSSVAYGVKDGNQLIWKVEKL